MSLFLKILVLSTFSPSLSQLVPALPKFSKHIIHSAKDLTISHSIDKNVTFSYMLCDRHRRSEKSIKCEIVHETSLAAGDGTESIGYTVRKCAYRLPARNYIANRKFTLAQLNLDAFAVVWKVSKMKKTKERALPNNVTLRYYSEVYRARVVNMSNCEFKQTTLTVDARDEYVVGKKKIESVEIVSCVDGKCTFYFRNEKLCGRKFRCRVTYDLDERRFSEPAPSFASDYDASFEVCPILSSDLTPLSYVIKSKFLEDESLNLINTRGRVAYRHEYSWSIFDLTKGITDLATSYTYETFGVCQIGTTQLDLDCSLFNADGVGRLGVSVNLNSQDVKLLKMFNRVDGGFLAMIGYAEKGMPNGYIKLLDVLRIDSKGVIMDVLSVPDVKCSPEYSSIDVNLFERSGFHFCYYVACNYGFQDDYHLNIYSQCYGGRM